jgi:hypothetical protein
MEKNSLNKLLVDLICNPRQINCDDYPKDLFVGTMLKLVTKSNGYYWNIFNKQRVILIEKLLKDGADPNQNNNENIPLLFCSLFPYQFKGLAITELLLKYGADPNVKYNNFTLVDKVNKKYVGDLLSLLLKYDYILVEVDTPFNNHVVVLSNSERPINIDNELNSETPETNNNYYCCFRLLCCF